VHRINDPYSGLQTGKLVFLPIEVGRIGNPSWIGINRINNPRSDMLIGVFRMQSKEAGSVSYFTPLMLTPRLVQAIPVHLVLLIIDNQALHHLAAAAEKIRLGVK